ncbi:MAG: hypothetical protein ACR2MS_06010, partial [Weeksellaceae bacterium]
QVFEFAVDDISMLTLINDNFCQLTRNGKLYNDRDNISARDRRLWSYFNGKRFTYDDVIAYEKQYGGDTAGLGNANPFFIHWTGEGRNALRVVS